MTGCPSSTENSDGVIASRGVSLATGEQKNHNVVMEAYFAATSAV